ncbi:hypothetical protein GCM10011504_56680 [Siccirubricoccus deserti]|uniref:Uncharacterized protein n=1 Tax=Siccirubricoccus deserti TaxID=2013562 RepID=A0A9X0R3S4_9PROT|nr:hypothetical protein [Siccirubricoccus deserti]MBC4019175.1 hypothetical protein [Siccirubricoccus deserti]GGC71711.1 hypothetical protein GCM10011504_56680 [Siccirubricoccus deserti]
MLGLGLSSARAGGAEPDSVLSGAALGRFAYPFSDVASCMDFDFAPAPDHRHRAVACVSMGVLGLERDLPNVALIGAQAAARDLLLALDGIRVRPCAEDLKVLQEAAAMDRTRIPAGAKARLAAEMLAVLQRCLRGPVAAGPTAWRLDGLTVGISWPETCQNSDERTGGAVARTTTRL